MPRTRSRLLPLSLILTISYSYFWLVEPSQILHDIRRMCSSKTRMTLDRIHQKQAVLPIQLAVVSVDVDFQILLEVYCIWNLLMHFQGHLRSIVRAAQLLTPSGRLRTFALWKLWCSVRACISAMFWYFLRSLSLSWIPGIYRTQASSAILAW